MLWARLEGVEKLGRIAKFLQGAIDETEFELQVHKRREVRLTGREPNARLTSMNLDTVSLGQVASGELCRRYEQSTWRSGEWGERLKIKPIYSAETRERLTSELQALLERYIEDGHVGHAVASIEGFPITTVRSNGFTTKEMVSVLEDFRDYLIVATAILGAERVASHIGAWVDAKPLRYWTKVLLVGTRLDEPIMLDSRIGVERLSTMSNKLPESLAGLGTEAPETYLGGVVLSVAREATPAIFKPKKGENGQWNSSNDVRHSWALGNSSIDEFCEALSLSYGSCIRRKQMWLDYGELREFTAVSTRQSEPARLVVDPLSNNVSLTQSALEEAWQLHRQRISRNTKDGVGTAIGRWVNSMRPEATLQDQFIELRIALEALFLDGKSQTEMSFRMATRGAWYAGGNIQVRRRNHKALVKAYRVSSAAIHAGAVEDSDANRGLLKTIQSLCRAGVIQRLSEDWEPNWEDMILGG